MNVIADELIRDEGTVLVFTGRDDKDRTLTFATDRRPGLEIATALGHSDLDEVLCEVPEWAILSRQ